METQKELEIDAQIQRWYETLMEGKRAGGKVWHLYHT